MQRYSLKCICYLCCLVMFLLPTISFGQQATAEKTTGIDTIPRQVTGKAEMGKTGINKEIKELPSIKGSVSQLTDPVKKMAQTLLTPVNLFDKASSLFKVKDIHADIEYTYLRDTSGLSTGLFKSIQSTVGYDLGLSLSVANMPFDIRLAGNNGMYSLYNTPYNNFPQFNFNHKKYVDLLQKQVLDKVSPDKVLASVLSRINNVRSQYERSLKSEVSKIQQEYESEFKTALDLPANITDLSVNDLASLKTSIMPANVVEEYKQGNELYQELITNHTGSNDSLRMRAMQRIKKYESLGKIYHKVTASKEKFDNNPYVRELRSHLPFTTGNFKSYIKKPGNLISVIKEQASLSSIQQLFLSITKLDIGVNPLSGGELNLQGLMNKGVNAEFTGKRSSIGVIYGSGKANINNWVQSGLTSNVSNEYSSLTGIKLGSGWNSRVKQSISLNFFDFNASQDLARLDPSVMQSGYLSNANRRDAVITWQSSMDIAAGHKVSVDLSKSFGSYRNTLTPDNDVAKSNAFGDIFGNEGKSNYAAAVDYQGNLLKTDVQLSLKKAGLGYNNPGNVFVRKGESRVGVGVARKFLKQKLTVRYKTDFRSQYFDPLKRYTYTNFSNNVQLGYRLKRNSRVGMSVRHNNYEFNNDILSTQLKGSSFTLQTDASYLFRIKSKKVINHFMLSRQSFDIPMLTGGQYTSKTWLISQSSTIVLNKNLMTVTLLANQSDNKDYYFNTSFVNAEISYGYGLGEKIRLNSGAGFYSNTGWNRQLGLKQQISGTLFSKMDIDIDVSWKKAVKIIRKELANQVFVTSSVHYRF